MLVARYCVMMYTTSMMRTQIILERRQHEALKAWARATDRSVSELVRLAVTRLLGSGAGVAREARLADIRGIARDPRGPAGRNHDRVLYGRNG